MARWVSTYERYAGQVDIDQAQDREVIEYVVHFDATNDDPPTPGEPSPRYASTAPNIPAMGDAHPVNNQIHVVKVSAEHLDGAPDTFVVKVEYSSVGIGGPVDNPLMRPAVVEFFPICEMRPVWKGTLVEASGEVPDQPVTNSSGERPTDPIEEDTPRIGIRITRNEYIPFGPGTPLGTNWVFDPSVFYLFKGAVNIDPFVIRYHYGTAIITIPQRMALFANYGTSKRRESGVWYYEVSYELHINEETWDHQFVDMGHTILWRETSSSPGERQMALDTNGQPFAGPQLLDGQGGLLPTGAAPVYRRYHRRRELVFESLRFGI